MIGIPKVFPAGLFFLETNPLFTSTHIIRENMISRGEQTREQKSAQLLALMLQLRIVQASIIVTANLNCEEYKKLLQMLSAGRLTLASDIHPQKVCSHHVYPEFDQEK